MVARVGRGEGEGEREQTRQGGGHGRNECDDDVVVALSRSWHRHHLRGVASRLESCQRGWQVDANGSSKWNEPKLFGDGP